MKKIQLLFWLLFSVCCVYAQEPGNNLGKSLTQMRQEFPELRYIKSDEKGQQYEDGYPEDGIAVFFYFNNNVVVEECMIVQSYNGFPKMWFEAMKDKFLSDFNPICGVNGSNRYVWCYSTFKIHLVYFQDQGVNNAMIIYEIGGCGYPSGMTYKEFFDKYDKK